MIYPRLTRKASRRLGSYTNGCPGNHLSMPTALGSATNMNKKENINARCIIDRSHIALGFATNNRAGAPNMGALDIRTEMLARSSSAGVDWLHRDAYSIFEISVYARFQP